MNQKTIHLIEPTLQDETGHCCGYVTALLEASKNTDLKLELWIGNKAEPLFNNYSKKHCFFQRRLRKLQTIFLYYRLLKNQETIFIPTAGQFDLGVLSWLSTFIATKNSHIFLHFHQYKITDKKILALKKIAANHPEFNILAPTAKLLSIFTDHGFKNCFLAPCPSHIRSNTKTKFSGVFKYILYAGAARNDKGFSTLVKLINYLDEIKSNIPVVVQISPNHVGRYDEKTELAVQELKKSSYPYLTIYQTSLSKNAYLDLFEDAICLQLYDHNIYQDKFSGVTLDALYAACPIITTEGTTWISDTVNRFEAGTVVNDLTPANLHLEIEKISANYAKIQQNALHAGEILRVEHDPLNTLKIIDQRISLCQP